MNDAAKPEIDVDLMFRDLMACQHTVRALLQALVVTHQDVNALKKNYTRAIEVGPKVNVPYGKKLATADAMHDAISYAFQQAQKR